MAPEKLKQICGGVRVVLPLVYAAIASLVCGCASHLLRPATLAGPPVVVSDTVRESLPNDLDPDFIAKAGGDGTCTATPRLGD